jgi:hypothetical protein
MKLTLKHTLAAIILVLSLAGPVPVQAQRTINCDAVYADPDPEATLIKRLDDTERGFREMQLPKEKHDELLRRAKKILLKNYALEREMEATCDRERGRR